VDQLGQRKVLLAVGVVVALVAIVLIAVAARGGDDDTAPSTARSTITSTVAASPGSTTTTAPTPSTTAAPADLARSLYPDLSAPARFEDPATLGRAFATDYLGFDTDVDARFQDTGGGTGKVELRPHPASDPTVLSLAQLPDETWIVLGATTSSIALTTPVAGAAIASPQAVVGSAYAFEGHVDVSLFADGEDAPIGNTFVTGRGDGVLGAFHGQLTFEPPEGTRYGFLVLSSPNGEDGTSSAALAIRIAF
jgi:hypothetical protein